MKGIQSSILTVILAVDFTDLRHRAGTSINMLYENSNDYIDYAYQFLLAEFKKYADLARFDLVLKEHFLQNLEKDICEYNSHINPRTNICLESSIENIKETIKFRLVFYLSDHRDNKKGRLSMMLYDKASRGLYLGDYLAYRRLQDKTEILEYSNPAWIDMNNYEKSISDELGKIFWVLNSELYDIVIGKKTIDFKINKKSWRKGYE